MTGLLTHLGRGDQARAAKNLKALSVLVHEAIQEYRANPEAFAQYGEPAYVLPDDDPAQIAHQRREAEAAAAAAPARAVGDSGRRPAVSKNRITDGGARGPNDEDEGVVLANDFHDRDLDSDFPPLAATIPKPSKGNKGKGKSKAAQDKPKMPATKRVNHGSNPRKDHFCFISALQYMKRIALLNHTILECLREGDHEPLFPKPADYEDFHTDRGTLRRIKNYIDVERTVPFPSSSDFDLSRGKGGTYTSFKVIERWSKKAAISDKAHELVNSIVVKVLQHQRAKAMGQQGVYCISYISGPLVSEWRGQCSQLVDEVLKRMAKGDAMPRERRWWIENVVWHVFPLRSARGENLTFGRGG